jgi:hypothetical protein
MKNILSKIKKHRKKLIILTIILIVISIGIFAMYKVISYLLPDRKNSVYGDRCEITESITITKERKNNIKLAVEEYEGMNLSIVDVKCNLIDIIVYVDDETDIKVVKEMSKKVIATFTEEELKYYDLALWVDSNNEESTVYPIIGTKHKVINGDSKDHFVWGS